MFKMPDDQVNQSYYRLNVSGEFLLYQNGSQSVIDKHIANFEMQVPV